MTGMILGDRKERVELLKKGFSGKEIEKIGSINFFCFQTCATVRGLKL